MAEPSVAESVETEVPEVTDQTAGQTEESPDETSGTTATDDPATDDGQGESFFDPAAVPDELRPAYKQMQRAFTKKTQAIAQARQKIQAYDAFESDPYGTLMRLNQQYGINPAQNAQHPQTQQTGYNQQGYGQNGYGQAPEWQPQTWEEVLQQAEQRAEQRIMQRFAPVLDEVRNVKKSQIEAQLDETVPDWRMYEDEMTAMLQKHPTLANDPVALAEMAIPKEVRESKSMQKALKKLESKAKSAQPSGGSTAKKSEGSDIPQGPMSFDQAVAFAKARLAKEGLKP